MCNLSQARNHSIFTFSSHSCLMHRLLKSHSTTRVEPYCQLPSLLVQWSYQDRNTHSITSTDMYTGKCTESQVYNVCTYRQNSVSEVLSEDVRLSIYFHFKIFWTRENLHSIFIVRYHKDLLICFLV